MGKPIPIFEMKDGYVEVVLLNRGESYLGEEIYQISYEQFNDYLKSGIEEDNTGEYLKIYNFIRERYECDYVQPSVMEWKLRNRALEVVELLDRINLKNKYEIRLSIDLSTDNLSVLDVGNIGLMPMVEYKNEGESKPDLVEYLNDYLEENPLTGQSYVNMREGLSNVLLERVKDGE